MNVYNFKQLIKFIHAESECKESLPIKTHKKRKAVLNLSSNFTNTESKIPMGWGKRVEE
jgi:hypothetical protein